VLAVTLSENKTERNRRQFNHLFEDKV